MTQATVNPEDDQPVVAFTDRPTWFDSQPAEVFHYCDATAAVGVISTGTLWASLSSTLNDASEVAYGISAFDAAVEEVSREIAEIDGAYAGIALEHCASLAESHSAYVISASAIPDSLSQFRTYGDYALGVNTRADWYVPEYRRGIMGFPPSGWFPVVYRFEDVLEAAAWWATHVERGFKSLPVPRNAQDDRTRRDQFAQQYALWYLAMVTRIKHPAFVDEREVRRVVLGNPSLPVRVRATGRGVVPYVEVACRSRGQDGGSPLTSVHLGPGCPDVSHVGLAVLLQQENYDFNPTIPDIPFR